MAAADGDGLDPPRRSPPPFNCTSECGWCSLFQLIVRVFEQSTDKELDAPLPFTIIIDDMNDNAPTFAGSLQVTVPERSKAGEERGAAATSGDSDPALIPNAADRCRHHGGDVKRHGQRPARDQPRQDPIYSPGWLGPVCHSTQYGCHHHGNGQPGQRGES